MKEAKDKCKAAGEPETRWAEFLDKETLEQITKSETEKQGAYLTMDNLKLLRQADEDQKKQLSKLQQDMAKITDQLSSVLSLHTPPAHAPGRAVPTPVPTGTTVATTTTTPPVVTTAISSLGAAGFPPTPTGLNPTPPVTYHLPSFTSSGIYGLPSPTQIVTGTLSPTGIVSGSGGMGGTTWSNPPPSLPSAYSAPTSIGLSNPMSGHYGSMSTPHYGGAPIPHAPIATTLSATAPASYLSGPLTAALQNIVDSDVGPPGNHLRPEFFVSHKPEGEPLKNVSYKSMSYRKLIHGMVLVARNIVTQGGDINSYLDHMEYLTRHGKNGDYTDMAYVEYDKIVIDDYIQNPSNGIKVGDTMAASYCFHDVTRTKGPPSFSVQSGKKRKKPKNRQSDLVPEDYPQENCWT